MGQKSSTMARVPSAIKEEVDAIAKANAISFGDALKLWKQGESDVYDGETGYELAPVSPDVSGLQQAVYDLVSQQQQDTRNIVAGLSGLFAGQSEIAQAVNAKNHQKAVMQAVAQALETQDVSGRRGIMQALESHLGVSASEDDDAA